MTAIAPTGAAALLAQSTAVSTSVGLWWWVAFLAGTFAFLLLDLLVFHRDPHRVDTREATIASAAWVALGLVFAVVVWLTMGGQAVQEYLTGYLIEKSLSVDNLFVFVLIFSYFGVPNEYQHRVLFYGVLGAFVFRGLFIALGAALLAKFSWIAFVFGAFLIYTAHKLATHEGVDVDPAHNPVLNAVRRFIPMTRKLHGQRLFVRGRDLDDTEREQRSSRRALMATPLFAVLVVIETTDIIFAVDSIPAIFGVTRDPFIVFSSNAMALLGLRALYFLLADLVARFRYLDSGLALILGIVGVKLIYEEMVHLADEGAIGFVPDWAIVHVPPWAPLLLVALVLTVAVVLSVRHPLPAEAIETRLAQAGSQQPPGHGDAERSARRRASEASATKLEPRPKGATRPAASEHAASPDASEDAARSASP
ncbi:MAG TPA: TerC/Alx family metal homeostasis membrane protein [Nitriliruptorales bacterium]|nr:TerC/Alx family metal homeostasis membrane protein [Nitriliruptorales bacterium]